MRDETRKFFEKFKGSFRWTTSYGETLTLDEMDTKHIFNCMKMIWNHLAAENKLPTFWFTHVYREYEYMARKMPKKLIQQLLLFIYVIEERGDLSDRHREPYDNIIKTLRIIAASIAPSLSRELKEIKHE